MNRILSGLLFLFLMISTNLYSQSITIYNYSSYAWGGELVATTDLTNPQYSNSYASYEIIPDAITPGVTPSITYFSDPTQLSNPQAYIPGLIFSTSDVFIGMKGGMHDPINLIPILNADATVGKAGTYLGYPPFKMIPVISLTAYIIWAQMGNNVTVYIYD